jgi:serine/threonine protein kinase
LIHDAGYVHNDVKPSNLMFDSCKKLHLIDFGCATRYVDDKRQHISKGQVEKFKGNIQFASVNQLGYNKTSRRDDFISLLYLLVYLLNGIEVVYTDEKMTLEEKIYIMQEIKEK